MLIGCLVTFLLMNMEALRPKVGDMVVYRPNTQDGDVWQIKVAAVQQAPGVDTACILDPTVMAQQGGSLVVEARDDTNPMAQYRLHWAGAHTARGDGDCAGSADLTVSRTDLQKLANAAGGFGIDRGMVVR
jgi:hypothetical protein